jgi:hypothetical protein
MLFLRFVFSLHYLRWDLLFHVNGVPSYVGICIRTDLDPTERGVVTKDSLG